MEVNSMNSAAVGAGGRDNTPDIICEHPLTLWRFFWVWASIGVQSIGGGAATTLLIQRAFIERYRLVSADEFARLWSISVVAPGINLVAMAVLLGQRAHGSRGIAASLAGLLLPSAAIACAMAAVFSRLAHVGDIQAMMRGVVPATGGVMLMVAWNLLQPLLHASAQVSRRRTLVSGVLVLAGTFAISMLHFSPIAVLVGAAAIGALALVAPRQPKPRQACSNEDEHAQPHTQPHTQAQARDGGGW